MTTDDDKMKLYVYVMTCDDGTAPCIDNGLFTLSCCKPDIRRCAREKDCVVGLAGKELKESSGIDNIGKIVFMAEVTKKMPWIDYGKTPEFEGRSDNVYRWNEQDKKFERKNVAQLHESKEGMRKDVENGKFVLISDPGHFRYFGKNALSCPDEFEGIIFERKGKQKHKVYPNKNYSPESIMRFVEALKVGNADILGESHNNNSTTHFCQC
jgi:hypothetical protein